MVLTQSRRQHSDIVNCIPCYDEAHEELGPYVCHELWAQLAMSTVSPNRRVVEAIIQSAAIYSIASASLAITIFSSPDVVYLAVSQLLSPLIVRRLHLYIEGV